MNPASSLQSRGTTGILILCSNRPGQFHIYKVGQSHDLSGLFCTSVRTEPVSQFILPPGQLAPREASCPGISYPRPGYLHPRGASYPGRFILPPTHTEKILLCDVYYYLQHFNNYMQFLSYKCQFEMTASNIQLGFLLTRGGGQAVQGGLSCPQPRISKKLDNQQFLLHQPLQKYLVERDINFISVNLRCLHQMFSWVTYWQGVGGKLSRAVYLAPCPELQREWIIHKFYYTIYYRNI